MKTFTTTIIPKFLLAMLALVSMAFIVVPLKVANAQEANGSICINRTTGALQNVSTTAPKCPAATSGNDWYFYSGQSDDAGFCLTEIPPYTASRPSQLTTDGKYCITYRDDGQGHSVKINLPFHKFPDVTVPAPIPTPSPVPGQPPVPTPAPSPTTPVVRGDCEINFHLVGPLCVPNNPFKPSSIAGGDPSVAGIAVKIIRVLLYFAAIVAVIMIIIGGYYVMTAGGNATQATEGRKTLTNAIIGLAIIILAYIIVQAVINFLTI